MSTSTLRSKYIHRLPSLDPYLRRGRVERVTGLILEARGPRVPIGELCRIETSAGRLLAEVVGFRDQYTLLMALQETAGLGPGDVVTALGYPMRIGVGMGLLGRIVNGLGEPIDGLGPFTPEDFRVTVAPAPDPLRRSRIREPLSVGVRAIDGLLTIGQGQRVGIFSGSGIGKSILLGMMARYTNADVVVIGLIGERGREVREFIENDLGVAGRAHCVVVAVTSDQWPLLRARGAMVATTIAEYFREQGLRVLLLIDSITRYCQALREIGLSLHEPPATKGYPPSVFAALPKLLERAGASDKGSITAFYTVLVEGDDMLEPVADATRSILDGHIVLSRKLAAMGHYPPIDVLDSLSRVMVTIADSEHLAAATRLRDWLSAYRDVEDLIHIGAYAKGSNPKADIAMERLPKIEKYLRQSLEEAATGDEARAQLLALASPS
ncbi:MAG: FliI/YscN family ATPase [Calditrichaeota bacterium]|nr:FliI/YscN family ATPase [Calditrichota bacterium]